MSDEYDASLQSFSAARRVGDLLFCSGQIGLEADGTVPVNPARQFELCFAALGDVLSEHGFSPADIVDLTTFHVDYPANMDAFMAAKANFLNGAKPCWTAVGIAKLGYPETLVEVKAIATLAKE